MDPELKKRTERLELAAHGLRRLGLGVSFCAAPDPRSFLPGVWVQDGELRAVPRLAHAGDLMHEAGHLAITPARFRALAQPGPLFDDGCPVAAAIRQYLQSREAFDLGPDDPMMRALLNAGELEAIAWSYAAALEIGVDPAEVFLLRYEGLPRKKQPYQGAGADVLAGLEAASAAGIHGLQHAGMCRLKKSWTPADQPCWPTMIRWIQP